MPLKIWKTRCFFYNKITFLRTSTLVISLSSLVIQPCVSDNLGKINKMIIFGSLLSTPEVNKTFWSQNLKLVRKLSSYKNLIHTVFFSLIFLHHIWVTVPLLKSLLAYISQSKKRVSSTPTIFLLDSFVIQCVLGI
jgi:hypothetical protein